MDIKNHYEPEVKRDTEQSFGREIQEMTTHIREIMEDKEDLQN